MPSHNIYSIDSIVTYIKKSVITLQTNKKATMKHIISILTLVLIVSCAQKKTETTPLPTKNTTENAVTLKTVLGEVKDITLGKDGYTAKVVTVTNDVYYATISRANLKHPDQYKSVEVGEKLKVSGDFWTMEGANQITVREILE